MIIIRNIQKTKINSKRPTKVQIITSGWILMLGCLKDFINQPNMIGSFASGANVSLVAKIGAKDLTTSCSVSSICNNRREWKQDLNILFYMNKIPCSSVPPFLHSDSSLFSHFFASIKNVNRFWNNGWILTFRVSKQLYLSSWHDKSICKWH